MFRRMASPTEPRCHTQQLIESLPDAAQAPLNVALAAKHITTAQILTVLTQHGLSARAENVNRHRRRLQGGNYACKCPLTPKATTP